MAVGGGIGEFDAVASQVVPNNSFCNVFPVPLTWRRVVVGDGIRKVEGRNGFGNNMKQHETFHCMYSTSLWSTWIRWPDGLVNFAHSGPFGCSTQTLTLLNGYCAIESISFIHSWNERTVRIQCYSIHAKAEVSSLDLARVKVCTDTVKRWHLPPLLGFT